MKTYSYNPFTRERDIRTIYDFMWVLYRLDLCDMYATEVVQLTDTLARIKDES